MQSVEQTETTDKKPTLHELRQRGGRAVVDELETRIRAVVTDVAEAVDGIECSLPRARLALSVLRPGEPGEDVRTLEKFLDLVQACLLDPIIAAGDEPSRDVAPAPPVDMDAVSAAVEEIEQGVAKGVAIAGDLQRGIIAPPAELYTALGQIASCVETLLFHVGYQRRRPDDSADLTAAAMVRRGVREGASHA